ncbi:hypothetical protein Aave_1303 [Paracidovorax citrulli AAC00-1]|uniref:Uncharacterized protein n=1 Tax=Paracidovorax citrulli (strain AAC00-1) TaxID=397945 RepID=A1TLQ6_PARC0|nr:hypothetical protein Aave_1303 [Paracidovorax citrulli AAC00-1]
MADERTGRCATHGGGGAADRAAQHTASHGADAGADLCIGRIGRASCQAQCGDAGGGGEEVAVIHGVLLCGIAGSGNVLLPMCTLSLRSLQACVSSSNRWL